MSSSPGISNALSITAAVSQAQQKELAIELEHLEKFPTEERKEMIKCLQRYGLTEHTLILAVRRHNRAIRTQVYN